MPIDRDATLKAAEKLLRQGKLDGAIAEYVRLLAEQPEDWNSVNALGDLYLRANKNDLAAQQFTRVADHQFAEGFFPKAAALYKKALKVKPEDEHIFMQLAEIGERQGKFADAKFYLQRIARQREERGEHRAAAECILRLGSLEGSDLDSKLAGAKAAQEMGDAFRAVELLKDAARIHDKEKRHNEALQLLADAAEIDPFDAELRNRLAREFVSAGLPNRARAYLSAETAGDDPDLLMALATIEFADGKEDDARTAMGRVLALAPEREAEVMRLADELMERGRVDAAFSCVDAVTDAALLNGDVERAAGGLQQFIGRTRCIPALIKLVGISVDAEMSEVLHQAQLQLADAYLEAQRGEEARVIAEDLVRADPTSNAIADRLRRALVMIGADDVEGAIAQVRTVPAPGDGDDMLAMGDLNLDEVAPGVDPTELPEVDIFVYPEKETAIVPPEPELPPLDMLDAPPIAPAEPDTTGFEDSEGETMTMELSEIDLSTALSGLMVTAPPVFTPPVGPAAAPAPEPQAETDIEDVFAQMRAKSAREQQASAALGQFEKGLQYLEQGLVKEAITELEAAVRVPLLRFRAAAQLGRIYIDGGDIQAGIGWLERAAEAPAPTPDDGYAVLYELAAALEKQGESARALAILMELDADADGYRDVRERVAVLSRAQTGSHSG